MEKVKLNFIYHFAPIKNDMFEYHIKKLHKYVPKFNNKRVVNIAVGGENLYSPEFVKEKLHGLDIEFVETPNDGSYRETVGFLEKLLPTVKSYDENEFTFFGHSKSNSDRRQIESHKKPHRLWTEYCYEKNLQDIDFVVEKLQNYDSYGIFKRDVGLEKVVPNSTWHYSGTFFWFKNSTLFRKLDELKPELHDLRYETEAFLGKYIETDKAYCDFDLKGDLGKAISIYDKNSSWYIESKKMKNKKIVIMPVFCEAHLVKYQIQNIVDTINPDFIIYNEGMFPSGPESTTQVSEKFKSEFTLDGNRGFDYEEMKEIIHENQKKNSGVEIILNEIKYPDNMHHAPDCYIHACSNFSELGIDIEEGDYIFPFEGDVFHHEDSKDEIQGYLEQLEPNTGFRSIWIDFMETQYYAEKKNLTPLHNNGEGGRSRRVCVRYGDMDFYKNVLSNFMTQQYPMLYPTELITYHYAWWRPGKYKELRFSQLNRHPQYWVDFNRGLEQIKENRNFNTDDVVLRPSSPVDSKNRYAAHVEIDHPKHIKEHPNYLR